MKSFLSTMCLLAVSLFTMAQTAELNWIADSDTSAVIGSGVYLIDEYRVNGSDFKPKKSVRQLPGKEKKVFEPTKNEVYTPKLKTPKLRTQKLVKYRGMLELGVGGDLRGEELPISASVSTSHGMMFGNYFFMGLGLGYSYSNETFYTYPGHSINYFLDLRTYMAKGNWVPYFGFKIGGLSEFETSDYEGTGIFYGFDAGLLIAKHFSISFSAYTSSYELPAPICLQAKLGWVF